MDGKNLKVVFFIGNMSHSGGTERVLSIIAGGLSQRGYQVSIMSLWGNGQTFFQIPEKIKIYWLEKEAPGAGILKKLKLLTSFLKQENTDFLIDVDIILVFYSLILKRLIPRMQWISWEHFNFFYHFKKNQSLRGIARRLVGRFSDHLVVLSEEDKGYYQDNLKLKCGITRIYNPNPYEEQAPKDAGEPIIFAAGRLTGVKGFDLLIESWKLLEPKYPQWTVLVAGEGEDREKLEKAVRDAALCHFHLVGRAAHVEQYYKRAEIFALPSRDEGFGMVLLEAMDFALPAVSFACKAGPREIVIEGENGFLEEPENTDVFARKLELLMTDDEMRREMGRKAQKSTCRFNKAQILDEWEKLLESMINQTG